MDDETRLSIPRISQILPRLDVPSGKRGRTICPVHRGDNRQAFSYDDKKGVWYCHRCAMGGDAIDLVKAVLGVEFRQAISWLGISLDRPLANVKTPVRRPINWNQGLSEWERVLRDEYYSRVKLEGQAVRRLEKDPDDSIGWLLLDQAYAGVPMDLIEDELDKLALMLKDPPRCRRPKAMISATR